MNDNAYEVVRRLQRSSFRRLLAEVCADGRPTLEQDFAQLGMQPDEVGMPIPDWFESLSILRASGVIGQMKWLLPSNHPDFPSPTPLDVI